MIRAREGSVRSRTDAILEKTTRTPHQPNKQHREERHERGGRQWDEEKANLEDAGTPKLLLLKNVRK